MKISDVRITSGAGFLDTLDLRKNLQEFKGAEDCLFAPGISAFPPTRPSFTLSDTDSFVIEDLFLYYLDIMNRLFYPEDEPDEPESSYGIRKEAKIGYPYFSKGQDAHEDVVRRLLNGTLDLDGAPYYTFGNRFQTDKIGKQRFTGYLQMEAIGSGFFVQRHRMINAGSASNHLLGIYEFKYKHRFLDIYKATFNQDPTHIRFDGYLYAIDYKNFERSFGWDAACKATYNRLMQIKRPHHAELYYNSHFGIKILYKPAFKNRKDFEFYLSCGDSLENYFKLCDIKYGWHGKEDEYVRETMKSIREYKPQMQQTFEKEAADPSFKMGGYKVYDQVATVNPSGNAATSTDGMKYSPADTFTRWSIMYGRKYTIEECDKILKHETALVIINKSDDNVIGSRNEPFDIDKFLSITTSVSITRETPTGFLSKIFINELRENYFRNALLVGRPNSFYRKLSRERDIFSYKVPSAGWIDSYNYALGNRDFKNFLEQIHSCFKRYFMSISDIIDDAKERIDKPISEEIPFDLVKYVNDPNLLYKDNIEDPVGLLPSMFYAFDKEARVKVINNYGV